MIMVTSICFKENFRVVNGYFYVAISLISVNITIRKWTDTDSKEVKMEKTNN